MSAVQMTSKDEIIMKLVHYFVTEENYTPIVVNGVKDEIWLENEEGPYRIVRINSNYIHNKEQYDFDLFKTKSIIKQIKKKTFSFSVNTLNILLNVNDTVKFSEAKDISSVAVGSVNDVTEKKDIVSSFPKIKNKILKDHVGIDLLVNVTKDINQKTSAENQRYEQTFKKKPIVVTYVLMAVCIAMFLVTLILGHGKVSSYVVYILGSNYGPAVRGGEFYRLITSAFLHGSFIHLFFNMYALAIIGSQIETFLGRKKFIIIYFVSALSGSLMSIIFGDVQSIGASGAIFGILGALVYFCYYYRLYFGSILKSRIFPVLMINLALGFMVPGIDVSAHIGGLVGGFLVTMALGIDGKSKTVDRLNGFIVLILFLAFITYMGIFAK